MKQICNLMQSWSMDDQGLHSMNEILDWVEERNRTVQVRIDKTILEPDGFWYYSEETGRIQNRNQSFFSISGFQEMAEEKICLQQPIILQNEIGYLGILCKQIHGVLHLLMQAKIEPGNINKIQISPTIQATKSNFTQKHGGNKPPYLDYFIHAEKYRIIYDQIQSEQSSRFYKKRNRNIMIEVGPDTEIEVLPSHKWMTLGQIKALMNIENLVNMDTRTVLSGIPFTTGDFNEQEKKAIRSCFRDLALYESVYGVRQENQLPKIYRYVNDYKMFDERERTLIPLKALQDWNFTEEEIVCRYPYDFKVVFCDIEMEGREVKQWTQPLFEATGIAMFGLFMSRGERREFLVHAKPEVGCFDLIELGPTVQAEPTRIDQMGNDVERIFRQKLEQKQGILKDVLLSEEGGRFYHEQNRNVIIEIDRDELDDLPPGYFWVDFYTLNQLIQINNCLNIQLRNLLSLLDR